MINKDLTVGQEVYAHQNNEDYYSGEGIIKAILKWRHDDKIYIAVYFSGKGTVWFNPSDVKELVKEK